MTLSDGLGYFRSDRVLDADDADAGEPRLDRAFVIPVHLSVRFELIDCRVAWNKVPEKSSGDELNPSHIKREKHSLVG